MIRKASGYDIKGIVGMDFLRSCIIRIDFDHGKVAFLRSVGKHLGTALPFNTTDDYRPLIRPEIPGYGQEPFIVDTGCSCTGGICKKTYDELLRRQLIKPSGHSRCTTLLGGDADENVAEFRSGILAALRLANWSHCDLRFDELASSTLGLGYLSRYIVTIDFPRQVMYLKEGLALTRPDKDDLSGLALVRIKGETVVWGVRENSAAAIGGIKVKDVLIKMDDEKAEALSLFALRNALCCEGRTIRFTIRRGTEERLVSLRLADKPEREIDAIENSPRQMPTLKPIRKIRCWNRPIDSAVWPFLEDKTLKLPLLIKPKFFFASSPRHVCYMLAGSFTAFLIRRHGWERYRSLFRRCNGFGFRSKFRKSFGVSLEKAEWQWRTELAVMQVLNNRLNR